MDFQSTPASHRPRPVAARRLPRLLLCSLLTLATALPLAAQPDGAPGRPGAPDLERLIRDGLAEQVEARFPGGGRTYAELRAVAQAYTNKARKQRSAAERKRAFERAEEKYERFITTLAQNPGGNRPERDRNTVQRAAARVEYGSMLLGGQALEEVEQLELSNGTRGDRARLARVLNKAREQFETAENDLKPLIAQLAEREEDLLAAGVFDLLQQSRLDGSFRLAWTYLYLGRFEARDAGVRTELLRSAARRFRELAESGRAGTTIHECRIGLGLAQRELGELPAAERSLAAALREEQDRAVAAQARYELARTQIAAGRFDDARATLKPLVDKDPAQLSEEDRPARFYINLAHLWDAASYLAEADAARREAETSTARTALTQKAQRLRETGLIRMKRLSERGGSWPGVVQIHVTAGLNLRADPKTLSPLELLFIAGQLIESRRYREAEIRLREAAGRPDLEPGLAARILFDLGKVQDGLNEKRAAAATFQQIATQFKSAEQAPRAAATAFKLWAEVATRSRQREDYQRLADTLLTLVQSYPNHENREEALWWLPVALQAAGKFSEAAAQFGTIPPGNPRYDEAQFRRALCGRLAAESARSELSPEEYRTRARQAVAALTRYAEEAHGRAAQSHAEAAAILKRAADARVSAAELLVAAGLEDYSAGLSLLETFEASYPGSPLIGRVLGVRIRAFRGLKEFERASQILAQFLRSVPPEQAGGVLTTLARGMQDEVERLREDGQVEAARQLAGESVTTFQELEQWVLSDEQRAASAGLVRLGRAQMLYFAGQLEPAGQLVEELLRAEPRSGGLRRLRALILTERIAPDAGEAAADLRTAEEAWAQLLIDPALRSRAPDQYWEARYHWLSLLLRQGRAADVESAIRQDRIWHSDLGGAPWADDLIALYARAAARLGLPTELPPAEPVAPEPVGEPDTAPDDAPGP